MARTMVLREPAIKTMAEAIRAERATHSFQSVLTTGPRYSSTTMGAVERAKQEVICQICTLKLSAERSGEVNLSCASCCVTLARATCGMDLHEICSSCKMTKHRADRRLVVGTEARSSVKVYLQTYETRKPSWDHAGFKALGLERMGN